MADFKPFAQAIHDRLAFLSKHELYEVDLGEIDLRQFYLAAFPEGTNPIFRNATEHDCSCCKNFIKGFGAVVAIIDGKVETLWDVQDLEHPYSIVASAMDKLIKGLPIKTIFRTSEPRYGAENTKELRDGVVATWNHFWGVTAKRHLSKQADKDRGDFATNLKVFRRGLDELLPEAVAQVLDLISSNAIYRGEEHRGAVNAFKTLQLQYLAQPSALARELWLLSKVGWATATTRFRNTAIGTLVQDLSTGVDLDKAVKSFESKVAPANYKRPKALITPAMVKSAMDKINELGIEPSMQRRMARMSDISVNNVLWVAAASRNVMRSSLEDSLMQVATRSPKKSPATSGEEISIDDFLTQVMPGASAIEMMVKNSHRGNFMTLTTAVHGDAPGLFKWGNPFAWSYSGNIADSDMRAAVQAKGGRVDGAFRFTHSWNHEGRRNGSLMDLHVFMPGRSSVARQDIKPDNPVNDYYGNAPRVGWNRRHDGPSGGVQDVDYTDVAPAGYIPVENITFPDLAKMPEGTYICKIHNWNKRAPNEGGFKAEIEFGGQIFEYDYPQPLGNKQWITVAEVTLKAGQFSIKHHLTPGSAPQGVWGLTTEQFVPVQTILNSPNHWDGQATGNRHTFFILEGCRNPEPARGIYNEFLKPDLDQHRKVFEILGDKTKCAPTDDQLSGLGFSSTRGDTVTLKVTGPKGQRQYTVKF